VRKEDIVELKGGKKIVACFRKKKINSTQQIPEADNCFF